MINFERVHVGEYYTNCYIFFNENNVVLIDPAFDTEKIEQYIGNRTVDKIILTHGHLDHIYMIDYFQEKYNSIVYIHEKDMQLINNEHFHAPDGLMKNTVSKSYKIDKLLKNNDKIDICGNEFVVIHTPGHTPGSICLYQKENEMLITGDTLFAGTIGRYDFPLSDESSMISSLQTLMELPDEVKVHAGHYLRTSIGRERKNLYGNSGELRLK